MALDSYLGDRHVRPSHAPLVLKLHCTSLHLQPNVVPLVALTAQAREEKVPAVVIAALSLPADGEHAEMPRHPGHEARRERLAGRHPHMVVERHVADHAHPPLCVALIPHVLQDVFGVGAGLMAK